jgi:hypothetical protein
MSSPTTPSSTPASFPNKRRSARVHKRDPIVAPGFGTLKDLNTLSTSLGLPLFDVQAMMESRGRGIRGRTSQDDDEEEKQPPTPSVNAWADFMMEEGMTEGKEEEQVTTKTTTSSTETKTTAPSTSTSPREYMLPLEPSSRGTTKKSDHQAKKKIKTTTPTYVLVQTGTLDATMVGRTKRALDKPYDLTIPTIIAPKLKVTKVIAGSNAAHAICISSDGNVYGWGRNDAHQLSQSLPDLVPLPSKLPLEDVVIVDGAVGKSHSILLDSNCKLHAVGSNKCGQCGINSSVETVANFRKCPLDGVNIVQVQYILLLYCCFVSVIVVIVIVTHTEHKHPLSLGFVWRTIYSGIVGGRSHLYHRQ